MTTKVPAELSSTPSISDSGNATAITIDSSERVGILQSSPTSNLHIGATGNDAKRELRLDGTNGSGQTYGCIIQADGENGRFVFKVGQSGNTPAQQFMVHPDGGICFGTDTAAANALDDYEEGTFTPAVSQGISSVAYTTQTGSYTKIGNLCHVVIHIHTSSGTGNSARVEISGLPFPVADTNPAGTFGRAYSINFTSSSLQFFLGLGQSSGISNGGQFYNLDGSSFVGTSIGTSSNFQVRLAGVYRTT